MRRTRRGKAVASRTERPPDVSGRQRSSVAQLGHVTEERSCVLTVLFVYPFVASLRTAVSKKLSLSFGTTRPATGARDPRPAAAPPRAGAGRGPGARVCRSLIVPVADRDNTEDKKHNHRISAPVCDRMVIGRRRGWTMVRPRSVHAPRTARSHCIPTPFQSGQIGRGAHRANPPTPLSIVFLFRCLHRLSSWSHRAPRSR